MQCIVFYSEHNRYKTELNAEAHLCYKHAKLKLMHTYRAVSVLEGYNDIHTNNPFTILQLCALADFMCV